MKNKIIFFLLICTTKAFGDIGIVRLTIYPDNSSGIQTIELYTDTDTLSLKTKISLFFSNHGGIQLGKSFDSLSVKHTAFDPLSFLNKGQMVSIHFRCNRKINNWYEVIIDENSGKSLWILSNNDLRFYDWNTFLKKNLVAIAVIKEDGIILKKAPSLLSDNVDYKIRNCFLGKKTKEDWIYIKSYTEFCFENGEYNGNIKAWLKFKENDKMLIKITDIFELK